MTTLSLAMIVKNEEEVLDRCLLSVSDLVNQIIIVDTGSTDKTIEIAKKYNAEVYQFDWIDDFSAARNFSFSKCTSTYIMWLDADDIVKPQDKQKILEYLSRDDWDALLCRYIYSHDENDNPQLILKRHRILRNHPSVTWNDPIHEYLSFYLNTVFEVDIDIHHYRTAKGFNRAQGRNLRILEKLYDTSATPRHTFYYARELADNGDIDKAIDIFQKYLNEKLDWEGNIINAYQKLALLYLSKGDVDKAIQTCLDGISYNPLYIEIYNILIRIYYDKQDWAKVIRWCEMVITIPLPDAMHSYQPSEYTFVPYDRLCFAYYHMGEIQKSFQANEKALSSNPTGDNLQRCLFNQKFLLDCLRKDGQGKKLNLGCGGKRLKDYVNCDVVKTSYTDDVFSMVEIPYKDGTINGIYCEHALEHLGHNESVKAIQEFSRVLQPGGELQLYVPDLERCCIGYLNNNQDVINGYPAKEWFKYTVYGIQKDENGVPAEYQQHKTGFNKIELVELLENNELIVDYCVSY